MPLPTPTSKSARAPTNVEVAAVLERIADLLEAQGANPFRASAYRNGARTLRELQPRLAVVYLEQGLEGLEALPGIGRSLALVIGELLETGRSPLLQRLQGEAPAEALFATIPGLGAELSHRIHTELHIETLEELEAAAHDGRLERVPGFGPRRARNVREVLASRLSTSARHRTRGAGPAWHVERPGVGTLLEIDAEYRTRAAAGELLKIAPRRFNPSRTAWLPILHLDRDGWAFTALFSNTARAHQLGMTTDWVIVFYERDGIQGQCTLVSETHGALAGRRVVRGREDECRAHYGASHSASRPAKIA